MVRINIGGFELDSNKLPNEGLDYSKFDVQTQRALSVFDKDNKKGHLSLSELQKAVSFFASKDGITERSEGVNYVGNKKNKTIYHKKDGKLDEYEKFETQKAFDEKKVRFKNKKALEVEINKHVYKYIEEYKSENHGKMPSDKEIEYAKKVFEEMLELDNSRWKSANMYNAVAAISRAIEAEKRGLKPTELGENVYKSKDNKFYTYNNGKFYHADSKGNYRINTKINEKGQKFSQQFDKDGNLVSIQARNYQNKVYTNPKFASEVLNIDYNGSNAGYGGGNFDDSKKIKEGWTGYATYEYEWDDKTHSFIVAKQLNPEMPVHQRQPVG